MQSCQRTANCKIRISISMEGKTLGEKNKGKKRVRKSNIHALKALVGGGNGKKRNQVEENLEEIKV